jgi:hypothetical protein
MPREKTISYWIIPTNAAYDEGTEKFFRKIVSEMNVFAFRSARVSKSLKPGDRLCFYASPKGIIADARAASFITNDPMLISSLYPYVFQIDNVSLYIEKPVRIDSSTRRVLDAFSDKDPNRQWAWFVQTAHRMSEHDFRILTNKT